MEAAKLRERIFQCPDDQDQLAEFLVGFVDVPQHIVGATRTVRAAWRSVRTSRVQGLYCDG